MINYYEGHILIRHVDLEQARDIAYVHGYTPSLQPIEEPHVHLTSRDKDIHIVAYNGELVVADLKKIEIIPIRFIIYQILKDQPYK